MIKAVVSVFLTTVAQELAIATVWVWRGLYLMLGIGLGIFLISKLLTVDDPPLQPKGPPIQLNSSVVPV